MSHKEARSKWRIVKYNAMIGTEVPSVSGVTENICAF